MTLGELISIYRPHLLDETVGVQRSWEDTFRYTLKFYPLDTLLEKFDLDVLATKMDASGINPQFVAGYVERGRRLLDRVHELEASRQP